MRTREANEALVYENSASLELMKKLMADKTEFEDKYNFLSIEARKLADDLDKARLEKREQEQTFKE